VTPAASGHHRKHHDEAVAGPSGEGTVVIDVGGDRGALIVWVPAALDGTELEVRREGEPWRGEHTAVRPRHLRDGTCFAAVYGSLVAGRYQLRVRGNGAAPAVEASVVGGSIAEATWPDHPTG
jgi:hypothetical protein